MKLKMKFLCALFLLVLFASSASADNISDVKAEFMSLYDSEWKAVNFNYKLFTTIDKDFDEYTSSMMPGLRSFQFLLNYNNIAEKILASVFRNFHSGYLIFLRKFHIEFHNNLENNPKISLEATKGNLAFSDVVELYYKVEQKMLESVGDALYERINDELSTPYYSLLLFAAGIFIFVARNIFIKKSGSSTRKDKKIRMVVSAAGALCFLLGGILISRSLFFTKAVVRDFIHEQTKNFYVSEVPEMYWNIIQEHIKSN